LKLTVLIWFCCLFQASSEAQYFFTGEVRDVHGDKLQNGSIFVRSTGLSYKTGFYGEFRIISRRPDDTLTLNFEGYEPYTVFTSASEFLQITLKRPFFRAASTVNYLKCSYRGFYAASTNGSPGPAAPSTLVENPFLDQDAPMSFICAGDRLSYSTIDRFLDMGFTVPSDAVQIEGILNHFNNYYEDPENNDVFQCSPTLLPCPWNRQHRLLCLDISARKVNMQNTAPGNFVFLIDASGSMDLPNKLPMIKSGIRSLIDNLRDVDAVSVVEFGGRVRTLMEGVQGSQKGRIIKNIEAMVADGPTPGEEGIKMAYEVARRQFIQGGNNRVILITDGDINDGLSTGKELEDFVAEQSDQGINLTCIGVGMNGEENSELSILAQKGQGEFACADDEQSAERLLVRQLSKTPLTVADSVGITIAFDSTLVKSYRLIGYDNKKSLLGDTTARLGCSHICSGHSFLSLIELIPRHDSAGIENLAHIRIDYCLPGQHTLKSTSYPCPNKLTSFDRATGRLKRATCIAIFGMKLRRSAYVTDLSWLAIEKMAKKNFTGADFIDKEYLALVAKAKKVYMADNDRPGHGTN
jgi:Ca-activated chloride channel family protein